MERDPLLPEQRAALVALARNPLLSGFYLVGGSAVACHLGHRVSRDLDLFTGDAFDPVAAAAALAPTLPNTTLISTTDVMARLLVSGTPVDLVRTTYPLLEPLGPGPEGIGLASLLDLAAWKLATIARRGLRRDFWDLHAILQTGLTLEEAGRAYLRKFGVAASDLYHVARALTYFDDAEREPMPAGMTAQLWSDIRGSMGTQAPRLLMVE
jgi:hypothetical protein